MLTKSGIVVENHVSCNLCCNITHSLFRQFMKTLNQFFFLSKAHEHLKAGREV